MDLGTGEKALEYPVFGRVPGGALLKSLSVAGAKPEDITDVFLTHMHMDHTGWTSVERDGRYILTFPNATYWCAQAEWEYWTKTDAPFATPEINDYFHRSVLEPLTGNINFVAEGQEMATCLTAHHVPGHTPGLVILKLQTAEKTVWFTSDIFHSIVQFREPDWHTVYDINPEEAAKIRRKMLPEFTKENVILANGHFPNAIFGRLTEQEGRLNWEPYTFENNSLITKA